MPDEDEDDTLYEKCEACDGTGIQDTLFLCPDCKGACFVPHDCPA